MESLQLQLQNNVNCTVPYCHKNWGFYQQIKSTPRWDTPQMRFSHSSALSLLKAFWILLFSFPLLTGPHTTRAAIAEDAARARWQVINSSWMLRAWPHFWPREQLNKLSAEHFVVNSPFSINESANDIPWPGTPTHLCAETRCFSCLTDSLKTQQQLRQNWKAERNLDSQ